MRAFNVVPLRAVDSYDSMAEAISAAMSGPRVREARETSVRFRGQKVVAVRTEIDTTVFKFSNGLLLQISLLSNGDPAWSIEECNRERVRLADGAVECIVPIRLLYQSGGKRRESVWRPHLDAKGLIGRNFLSLFPSSCWLFVDFQGQEMMFSGFRDVDTGERILHWGRC
jgi:hypothetical protein